jgi:hypothetical protein
MSLPASLTALGRDDLMKLVLAQHHQIAELMAKVEALQAEVERLKREGQQCCGVSPVERFGMRIGVSNICLQPGLGTFDNSTPLNQAS